MKKLLAFFAVLFMAASLSAQVFSNEPGTKSPWKKPVDEKYLAGAVPEVNGKVVFTRTVELQGAMTDTEKALEKAKLWVSTQLSAHPDIIARKNQGIDHASHSFKLDVAQWLVFTNAVLSLDRTKCFYTLQVAIQPGKATLTVSDIHYLYEEEREPRELTAEQQITDKAAIKKGKSFYPEFGKFRVRTIQMVDSLEESFQNYMR